MLDRYLLMISRVVVLFLLLGLSACDASPPTSTGLSPPAVELESTPPTRLPPGFTSGVAIGSSGRRLFVVDLASGDSVEAHKAETSIHSVSVVSGNRALISRHSGVAATCNSSTSLVELVHLATSRAQSVMGGSRPSMSPDSSRIAALRPKRCPDETVTPFPMEVVVIYDMMTGLEHTISLSPPLTTINGRQLSTLEWIDNDTLAVLDFEGNVFEVSTTEETFGQEVFPVEMEGRMAVEVTPVGIWVLNESPEGREVSTLSLQFLSFDGEVVSAPVGIEELWNTGSNAQGGILMTIDVTLTDGVRSVITGLHFDRIDW